MNGSNYKRSFLLGLILISLGVAFNTTLENGSIGTVFIALGGFFFVVSMARKRKEESKNSQ